MQNKKRVFSIIILIFIGALCSLYFYNQLIHVEIPIHSDDVGAVTDLRDIIEFGNSRWSYWILPLTWVYGLLYGLLGPTELFVQSFFTIRYFFCIVLALYIALYHKKKIEWWLLPIFIFFSMPGSFGTASIQPLKFHAWTILVPLFCLSYILMKGDDIQKIGKRSIVFLLVLSVLGLVEQDILIIITCWAPFALYWFIYFWQKGYVKKYINWILLSGAIVLIFGKILFGTFIYDGYGKSQFVNVEEFVENIGTGISGLLTMFNINLIGADVLQFSTLISGLRLILLIGAIGALVSTTKQLCLKKIENVSVVEAVLTLSAYVVIAAYLFGGKREDEISIRYAAYLYYIFVILLCRKLCQVIDKQQVVVRLRRVKINMLSGFFCVCIVIALDPITMTREENEKDVLANVILTNEELENGLASFWSAGVTSCLTGYHNEIQAVEWNEGQVSPYLTEWDSYRSGNRYYNFFVQDLENDFGITEEHLKETFGEYEEKYEVENNKIYLYDYDVRTAPLNIASDRIAYLSRNDGLEVQKNRIKLGTQDQLTIDNLYITTGKIRMTIEGIFAEDAIQLSSEQTEEICLVDSGENSCVYEIKAEKLYENMKLKLKNVSGNEVQIKNIKLERLENSIELPKENFEQEIYLTPGYYIFGIEGEGVKNSNISFEFAGDTVKTERINNGRKKVAYGIWIEEENKFSISANVNGQVEKVYYQNKILSTIDNPDSVIYNYEHGIQVNEKSDLRYGPYRDIEPGSYRIDLYGENLDKASVRFSVEAGKAYEEAVMLSNCPEHYIYRVDTEIPLKEFEVLIAGIDKTDANLYYYTLTTENEFSQNAVNLTYSYSDERIFTTGVKDANEDGIILNKDEICFGPYIDLPKGKYFVTIYGDNLMDSEISISSQSGRTKVRELEVLTMEDEKAELCFESEEYLSDMEVVVNNKQKEQIMVQGYEIFSGM